MIHILNTEPLYVAQFKDGTYFEWGGWNGLVSDAKGEYSISKTTDLNRAFKSSLKSYIDMQLRHVRNEEEYEYVEVEANYTLKEK